MNQKTKFERKRAHNEWHEEEKSKRKKKKQKTKFVNVNFSVTVTKNYINIICSECGYEMVLYIPCVNLILDALVIYTIQLHRPMDGCPMLV